ncbi:snRNA-activating protein complex subunit 5-like [Argopecten irradians]|uniref:snRNA-activating protein complex subunit 5-like n=1 Tax=Argopecten irradians TaxID=31199 RepID=UPI003713FC58
MFAQITTTVQDTNMAALKELRRLRDEERTLVNIASKVSDQLNRLKVEELALVSMIRQYSTRSDEEKTTQENQSHQITLKTETVGVEGEDNKPTELPTLDLSVQSTTGHVHQFDEEEEEDEDDIEAILKL